MRAASSASAWCAGGVGHALGAIGIDVRLLEQAGQELRAQHARDRAIDRRLGDAAALDQRDELGKAVRIGQLQVDAGLERLAAGVGLVARRRDGASRSCSMPK